MKVVLEHAIDNNSKQTTIHGIPYNFKAKSRPTYFPSSSFISYRSLNLAVVVRPVIFTLIPFKLRTIGARN